MVVTEQELNIGFYLFAAAWVLGNLIFVIRARRTGKAYLRRFPPIDGVPLDWMSEPRWPAKNRPGPVRRAYRTPQADPELEAMRQDGWKKARQMFLWMFGFPTIVWGTFFLLVAIGYVR